MRATVQGQEIASRPVCDLAVYAVRQRERRHVEAEALEVPNVLCLSRLAPRGEELLPTLNECRVVLWTSDHIEVDVGVRPGCPCRVRTPEERRDDKGVIRTGTAKPLDRCHREFAAHRRIVNRPAPARLASAQTSTY